MPRADRRPERVLVVEVLEDMRRVDRLERPRLEAPEIARVADMVHDRARVRIEDLPPAGSDVSSDMELARRGAHDFVRRILARFQTVVGHHNERPGDSYQLP